MGENMTETWEVDGDLFPPDNIIEYRVDHGEGDPTKIAIRFDPTFERMVGRAVHGNTPFDVPYISEIAPNLWEAA